MSEQKTKQRWKSEIQNSVRTIEALQKHISLSQKELEILPRIIKKFQMAVTPYYANLIQKDNPKDPIRRIIVPSISEEHAEGFYDTSGEKDSTKVRGLQHKYNNTALLLVTPACTSYCRYCFRKRFTLGSANKIETAIDWENSVNYIKHHREIDNVLVSGGDPFILPNSRIEFILSQLRDIDHIKVIRIGTKFLAFNPFRFSEDSMLLDILKKYNLPDKRIYIVAHYDHPNELTEESIKAVNALQNIGIQIINQAVLLKGVNDDPDTLTALTNKLYSAGIAPYYLFQQRPVIGSNHTRVSIKRGLEVFEEAKKKMSGIAKRVRYIMSHHTGKVEIFGKTYIKGVEHVIMKYHNARNHSDIGRVMIAPLKKNAYWLSDLVEGKEICVYDNQNRQPNIQSSNQLVVEE